MTTLITRFFSALLFAVSITFLSQAQSTPDYSDGYLTPPESIAEEVLAPRHESVTLNNLSPNGQYFLNTIERGMPQISSLAKPWYNIAGLQVDHRANRHRSITIDDPVVGLELIDSETGEARGLQTPQNRDDLRGKMVARR